MNKEKRMGEKKLRGSGGYAIAKITDEEQKKANLGGPELFLAGVGRLENDRFEKYYCNKCEKDYSGAPNVEFENPNEDLGENIILVEKGEYKCKSCNYVIAQYRKFDEVGMDEASNSKTTAATSADTPTTATTTNDPPSLKTTESTRATTTTATTAANNDYENYVHKGDNQQGELEDKENNETTYFPIENIIGMLTYDSNARLLGKVMEIGLRKIPEGKVQFSFKVTKSDKETKEITWNNISKIGDIIILRDNNNSANGSDSGSGSGNINRDITESTDPNSKTCKNCNQKNDAESIFCEECGKKLE